MRLTEESKTQLVYPEKFHNSRNCELSNENRLPVEIEESSLLKYFENLACSDIRSRETCPVEKVV